MYVCMKEDNTTTTLALDPLILLSSFLLAWLLALHSSRVAGQQAGLLQRLAQVRVDQVQRPADAQPHRAGLA